MSRCIFASCVPGLICATVVVVGIFGPAASAREIRSEKEKKLPTLSSLKLEFDVQRAELEKPLRELRKNYEAQLDELLEGVTRQGDLEKALAVKAEREGYQKGESKPAGAGFPELGRLQRIYEKTAPARSAEMERKLGPVMDRYRTQLAALQKGLTRQSRFDEALAVKAELENLAEMLEGSGKPSPAKPSTPPILAAATKDRPFENHLGMKFVPVPIKGGLADSQVILVSVWETRVIDFEEFLEDDRKREALKPGFEQDDDHPAVNVSWDDAAAFCEWLTEKDRRKGKLEEKLIYRLPTDHEWSCFVGIGESEDAGLSPIEKSGRIAGVFPWGTDLPPPADAGNLDAEKIDGFSDDNTFTAPVGTFAANRYGIHDLGGNVSEWCQDWYSTETKDQRTFRGPAWRSSGAGYLLSSTRLQTPPVGQLDYCGFRVVVTRKGED